jgi:chromosome segregation ATPase
MSAMTDDEGDRAAGAGHVRGADEASRTAEAHARLAGLQHSAAESLAAITAADAALRALAGQRVTAERALRFAAARHHAAARAVAAHERARPGPLSQLATRLRAGRDWRRQRPALEAALAAAELQLTAARQALAEAKDEFTGRLAARATAAATLRRLTAECAAARARIAALDGANPPAGNTAASFRHRSESR